MHRLIQDVKDFHDEGDLDYDQEPDCSFSDERDLQIDLIKEEFEELRDAYQEQDLVECADAITDLLYVVIGAYLRFGMADKAAALWHEVQTSNMTKVSASTDENGKLQKGRDFFEPRIEEVLNAAPVEGDQPTGPGLPYYTD